MSNRWEIKASIGLRVEHLKESRKRLGAVIGAGLRRAGESMRGEIRDTISKRYAMRRDYITSKIRPRVKFTGFSDEMSVSVRVTDAQLPMTAFNLRQTIIRKKRKASRSDNMERKTRRFIGWKVAISRGEGFKFVPGAWLLKPTKQMQAGGREVSQQLMKKVGGKMVPLSTISMVQALAGQETRERILKRGREQLVKSVQGRLARMGLP